MPKSLRAQRIQNCFNRATKTEILFMHRRNAVWALLNIGRLGEKTQSKIQKLLDHMRLHYDDLETQKQIDELQEKLDRQRDAMKRRLAKKTVEPKVEPPVAATPGLEPNKDLIKLWESMAGENK